MNPQQSQQLILEFVAQYHQQKRQAPTVGEIIRGSGVNSYEDVSRAIEALIQRGLITYVPGVGGAGFTTRQVRLTGRGQPAPTGAPGRAPTAAGSSAAPKAAPSAPRGAPGTAPVVSSRPTTSSAPSHHAQRPLPNAAGPAPPIAGASLHAQGGGAGWSVAHPLIETLRRPPALLAALFAGLAIGLLIGAWREVPGLAAGSALEVGPLTLPWAALAVFAVAIGLGLAIGRGQERGAGWTWPALARALGLASLGGLVALAWSWFGGLLSPLDKTGIPTLLEGLRILPALFATAWVPLPGAVTLGLVVATLIDFTGRATDSPALALAQILLTATPAEIWLARRGVDRGSRTLVVAGALIGLGSTAAAYLTVPGMIAGSFPFGGWPAEIIGGLLAGAAAGWAVAWLRGRRASAVAGGSAGHPSGHAP